MSSYTGNAAVDWTGNEDLTLWTTAASGYRFAIRAFGSYFSGVCAVMVVPSGFCCQSCDIMLSC